MAADKRYRRVHSAIREGQITALRQIFDYIPSEVVADDLAIELKKFDILINSTGKFKFGQILDLVDLLEVPEKIVFDWLVMQYKLNRKRGVFVRGLFPVRRHSEDLSLSAKPIAIYIIAGQKICQWRNYFLSNNVSVSTLSDFMNKIFEFFKSVKTKCFSVLPMNFRVSYNATGFVVDLEKVLTVYKYFKFW